MQSLIHGNFDGAARKKAYALVGAAAAIAAAVGPLLGGFVTTYLSWRVGFGARSRDHRGGALADQARPRRRVHRAAPHRRGRRRAVGRRHGRRRARHPRLAGRRRGGRPAHRDRRGRARCCSRGGSCKRKRDGQADAARPRPVPVPALPARDLPADDAADHPRRGDDRAAALPADDARVQRDGGRTVARAAVAQHVRGRAARRAGRPGDRRPADIVLRRIRADLGRAWPRSSRSCPGPTPAGGWSSRC